jgi:hypothetical protein
LLKSSRTTKLKTEYPKRIFGFELLKPTVKLVEPTGIEPVTSCLQSRRSPS